MGYGMSNAVYPLEKLLARDEALIERIVPWIEKTIVPYHRAEVTGIENIPTGPVLYVGNHNGALYSGDTWIFAVALLRAHGIQAAPHGLAHDLALGIPGVGHLLRRFGCVPAHPENSLRLLGAGRSVMVYPGGDLESMRPFRARNEVRFGGRQGYIRTALKAGVPIVPVAAQGAHATLIILDDLPGLAKALGIDKRFRTKVFPLSFVLPWGFVLGPTPPYIPFPSKIQVEVLPPIRFDGSPESADDADYVATCASHVETALQGTVTRLAAKT
jgi:1-acyl-sn-glycerol-3-phosphate acyltransferase